MKAPETLIRETQTSSWTWLMDGAAGTAAATPVPPPAAGFALETHLHLPLLLIGAIFASVGK